MNPLAIIFIGFGLLWAGIVTLFIYGEPVLIPLPPQPRHARPFFGSDIDHDPQGRL